MEPLVTVAIAAYNVENFLYSGIKYIQNQTYKNIEIILVDDGSTDNTPTICDELAKKDERIRVFHKENGGSGSARNVGIDNANGKYLYFFDIDDSIDDNFISESVLNAESKKADLIIYGYYVRFFDSVEEEKISVSEREIHNNDELKKAYCEELLWMKHGNGFVWNKFYRTFFLKKNGIYFGNQKIQQDEVFNMLLYPKLENVYICSKVYYHYVIYKTGNASSRYILHKEEIIKNIYKNFVKLYQEWDLDNKSVWDYIQNRFLSGMFQTASVNYFNKNCTLNKSERNQAIKRVINDDEVVGCNKKLGYGRNPLNNLQIWAFNNRKSRLFIFCVIFKNLLKKIFIWR